MGGVELLLEAAPQEASGLSEPEVGLLLTLGEFVGASAVAYLCGGTLADPHNKGDWQRPRQSGDLPLATAWASYLALPGLLLLGTGFANVAVAWVEFPVKLVVKSSKLIPTMLLSGLMGNSRRFSCAEYVAALLLCMGNVLFSYSSGRSGAPPELVLLGVAMLLVAVTADAAAVNAQQWLMQRERVAPESLMLRQNFVSMLICAAAVVATVGCWRVWTMVNACPRLVLYIVAVGLATALAIYANLHLIREAGSVVQVCVSLLRKFLAIVVSYVMFPKPFCRSHVASAALVVLGLLLAGPLRRRSVGHSRRAQRIHSAPRADATAGGFACRRREPEQEP